MTIGAVILWVHAMAALLLCAAAVGVARTRPAHLPRGRLIAALAVTALWALAVAGIGATDPATLLVTGLADLAWLAMLAALFPCRTTDRAGRRARATMLAAVASCFALGALAAAGGAALALLPVQRTALALRMLATLGALVLLVRGRHRIGERAGGTTLLLVGMAIFWSAGLPAMLARYLSGSPAAALLLMRGVATGVTAMLVVLSLHQRRVPVLSRDATMRVLLIAAGVLYLAATALAIGGIGAVGGPHARLAQTAFIVGTATALLTLAATPRLRAWTKVMVAKHLFHHRYDYRTEWLRFTETLGTPDGGATLGERVAKAIADLTTSPAALLLRRGDAGLVPDAPWQWEGTGEADMPLVRHFETTRRIIDLDAVRAGTAPDEEAGAVPPWLHAHRDGWALVPLVHLDRLVGAVVLARPPVARALDWEDFDLLGAAGRHAASHLAEEGAHAALAEARRFEEFNRRFAFIGHDLKNLVSQLSLVARNAERHADNPAFRADMVATLAESSQRMTMLLQRLSQHEAAAPEPARPLAVLPLVERMADARRAQHPVVARGDMGAITRVAPAALETALGHLIQNAVEASPAGVPVTVTVEAGADTVVVAVADRGAGMSPAFVRDELFRPFASARAGGIGLGAHEARAIVAAMGGTLAVDSRPGVGTTFRLRLPAAAALEEAA